MSNRALVGYKLPSRPRSSCRNNIVRGRAAAPHRRVERELECDHRRRRLVEQQPQPHVPGWSPVTQPDSLAIAAPTTTVRRGDITRVVAFTKGIVRRKSLSRTRRADVCGAPSLYVLLSGTRSTQRTCDFASRDPAICPSSATHLFHLSYRFFLSITTPCA